MSSAAHDPRYQALDYFDKDFNLREGGHLRHAV